MTGIECFFICKEDETQLITLKGEQREFENGLSLLDIALVRSANS